MRRLTLLAAVAAAMTATRGPVRTVDDRSRDRAARRAGRGSGRCRRLAHRREGPAGPHQRRQSLPHGQHLQGRGRRRDARQGRRRPGLARPDGAGRVGTMVESEGLADTFRHPGVSVSVRNLLELMLTVSDNTATDCADQARGRPGRGHRLGPPPGHRGPARRPRHGGPVRAISSTSGRARSPRRWRRRSRPIPKLEDKSDKLDPRVRRRPARHRVTPLPWPPCRSHPHRQGAEPGEHQAAHRDHGAQHDRQGAHPRAAARSARSSPRRPARSAARSTTSG